MRGDRASFVAIMLVAALASGCATTGQDGGAARTRHVGDASVGRSLAQPLDDLNLTHEPIPPALAALVANPYVVPSPLSCDAINLEIAELDLMLGSDVDAPERAADDKAERTNAMIAGALSQLSTSWMQGRSIVRRLTGASTQERKLREAVFAGNLRRAFLKGLRQRTDCLPAALPSAP